MRRRVRRPPGRLTAFIVSEGNTHTSAHRRLVYQYFFMAYKACYYIGVAGYVNAIRYAYSLNRRALTLMCTPIANRYMGVMFFILGFGRAFIGSKELRQRWMVCAYDTHRLQGTEAAMDGLCV